MPIPEFVIQLAGARAGFYFAARIGTYPTTTAEMKLACKYPSRLAALEEANKGPANFFDHAAIVPYSPQDAPEASGQPQGSPEGQESPLDRQNAGN